MKIILISLAGGDVGGYGIRILSACLKEQGCEVEKIFLARRLEDEPVDKLVELSRDADLVGISVMTNSFDNAVQITQVLKKRLNMPIIWGGIHPTIRPEECLEYADMVCIGEGEETLVELVQRIREGRDYYNIDGIWFKDKGKIIKNKLRPLISNLDSVPLPDWDYSHAYLQSNGLLRQMDEASLKAYMIYPTAYSYLTLSSRGCPFSCTYCCNSIIKKMWSEKKIVRVRSADNVIAELMMIKSKLPFIKCVIFDDDYFFYRSEKEIEDLAIKYKKYIGLSMAVYGIIPLNFNKKKFSLLVDVGMQYMRMGIQSGSERIRKLYNRHDSNQQIEDTVRGIAEFKDKMSKIIYDIILDNPWETEEETIKTLIQLCNFPVPYEICLYSLAFYPTTELYEKAKEEGLIQDDRKDVYCKDYSDVKKTYLNDLFFLLDQYTRRGKIFSPKLMLILTNRGLRTIGLSQAIYFLLKWTNKISYLLSEGIKDIRKETWSRIARYIVKRIHPGPPEQKL